MTPKPTAGTESLKQITHLAAALKAPRITESAARLADHARDAGWTHEHYLAAVLEREVAARNASGAQLRIRAAGMPAIKTIEDFDFEHHPGTRTPIHALASGAYLAEHRNVVLLGPPGTGKTHLATALGVAAARQGHRVLFAHRHRLGRPPQRSPRPRPAASGTDPPTPLRTGHRRRSRIPTLRTRRSEPVLPTRLLQVRARLADPDLQPALQLLGRCLRRPSRRRRDDRPHRPPRRRHRPQRHLLPPTQPRHRHPAQHQSRTRIPTLKPLTLRPPKPLRIRAPSTARVVVDVADPSMASAGSTHSVSSRSSRTPAISPCDRGQIVSECNRPVSACAVAGSASCRVEPVT